MEKPKVSNFLIAKNFNSDVVNWRQISSKIWSSFFLLVLILVHSVTANRSIINDLAGFISEFFLNLLQFYFWFYTALIIGLYWVSFSFYDKLFQVSPKVYANILEKLFKILYSFHSVSIAANTLLTFFTAFFMLKFYESNEYLNYFYIIGFCAFSNFILEFYFVYENKFLLKWPVIEQTKYARFKSLVYSQALQSSKSVFRHLLIWQFVYFLAGYFVFMTEANEPSQTSLLSSILVAFKLGFIFNFAHKISWSLYEIYMTEMYHFNIQQNINSQMSLSTAMSLNTHLYIQTLAFIDFCDLSIHSKPKRSQIFSLSYTSQLPVNWSKVSTEALNLIKSFINVFTFDDMLHGGGGRLLGQTGTSDEPSRFSSVIKRVGSIDSPIREPIQSSTMLDETNFSPKRSNLPQQQQHLTTSKFQSKLINQLKQNKIVSFFYEENPNYKKQQLFVDSFLVINSLKGLSNLAMYSLNEDEYGIVQQTLPDILNTFIHLQKVLEKYNPTNSATTISFKVLQKSEPERIELLIQKLIFILNESIFKITQTFGTSLKTLNLSEEVMKRLNKYYLNQ